MGTTAIKRAAGLEKSDADRLRPDLEQLRRDVALLSDDIGASVSRQLRSNTAAARSDLEDAQEQALAAARGASDEIRANPLTVAAIVSAVGLLALTACTMR